MMIVMFMYAGIDQLCAVNFWNEAAKSSLFYLTVKSCSSYTDVEFFRLNMYLDYQENNQNNSIFTVPLK